MDRIVFLAVILIGASAGAAEDIEWNYYRAAIAAASAGLRLDDVAEAQSWLDRAPEKRRNWEWRYLRAEARRGSARHQVSVEPLRAIAVSADGRYWAAGGAGKSVVLCDVQSGGRVKEFAGSAAGISGLAFSPDGRRLAASSPDQTLRVWEIGTGGELWKIEDNGHGPAAVAWSPSGGELASASAATQTGPEGNLPAGLLSIYDAGTGKPVRRLPFLVTAAQAVAWSADGQRVAAGNAAGVLAVWDTANWAKPPALIAQQEANSVPSAVLSVGFLPDSRSLVAGYADGRALVWDLRNPMVSRRLEGHTRGVNAVGADPAGRWLATLGVDASLRLWASDSFAPLAVLHHATTAGTALAFSADGGRIYTAHADGGVLEWRSEKIDPARGIWRHAASAQGFEWSPDGKLAASAGRGGTVKLWDAVSGRQIWEQYAHQFSASAILFAYDQARLYSAGEDGRVQGIDAKSGNLVMTFEHAPNARAASMALSPDGLRFIAATTRPNAKVFDVLTGASRLTIEGKGPGETGEVWGVDWSADGSLLALGWTGGGAVVADSGTGAVKAELKGHNGAVHGVAFSPDGKTVATGCQDGKLRLFSSVTGELIRTFSGHTEAVFGIDFLPDGTRLASASADQTARVWDPATGDLLLTLPFAAPVRRVRFSPDGTKLAVLPADGTIRVLDGPR